MHVLYTSIFEWLEEAKPYLNDIDIKDLFDSLSQSAQKDFEKRLETIAREQGNKLSELDNLNEADYPTLDDFLSAREEIRDVVKRAIEADFEDFLE